MDRQPANSATSKDTKDTLSAAANNAQASPRNRAKLTAHQQAVRAAAPTPRPASCEQRTNVPLRWLTHAPAPAGVGPAPATPADNVAQHAVSCPTADCRLPAPIAVCGLLIWPWPCPWPWPRPWPRGVHLQRMRAREIHHLAVSLVPYP